MSSRRVLFPRWCAECGLFGTRKMDPADRDKVVKFWCDECGCMTEHKKLSR